MIAIDGPAKHGEGARQRRRRVRPVRFGPSMPRAGIGQCGASREMDCVDTTAPDSREDGGTSCRSVHLACGYANGRS